MSTQGAAPQGPASEEVLGNWTQLLLHTLADWGIRQVVISPGSRSTPLVLAARADKRLTCYCIVDERSAAFFALGQARVTRRPSLLICTSGTAAANYFPATIEACQSGLPLVILSADRPAELQYCSAQQTIEQTRLFGTFARFVQLGEPREDLDARQALRRTVRAAMRLSSEARTPIHFNLPLRKPLQFNPKPPDHAALLPELMSDTRGPSYETVPTPAVVDDLARALRDAQRPLVIAGAMPVQPPALAATLARFLELTGSLLCAEAVSQLRFGTEPGIQKRSLDGFDWLYSDEAYRARLLPDFILALGGEPLSLGLQQLLGSVRNTVPMFICADHEWADSNHRGAQVVRCPAPALLEAVTQRLQPLPGQPGRRSWGPWAVANEAIWRSVESGLAAQFTEAEAVRQLAEHLPNHSLLMVGNSLAPRHLDRYCRATNQGLVIGSQRGVSGIEGAVAAALGGASVFSGPVTLLAGDVSFIHDLGSLWAASEQRLMANCFDKAIVLVIINNEGGRIFEQLPIASSLNCQPSASPRCISSSDELSWWTTPHRVSFKQMAQAFSLPHFLAEGSEGLKRTLAQAYLVKGPCIVEVLVPPSGAQQTARRIRQAVTASLVTLERDHAPDAGAETPKIR